MKLIHLKLLLTAIFWGGTFIAGRALSDNVAPFSAAFLRFFMAAIPLLYMTYRMDGRFPPINKEKALYLLLLGLSGVFAYNVFFFKGLRLIHAGRASLIIEANYASVTGAILLFPAALAEGMVTDMFSYSLANWFSLFYLGIFGTVLGFVWYYEGIQKLGLSKASLFINFVPISAIILAFLFLNEPITLSLLAGAVMVSLGVYLTNTGSLGRFFSNV
jgi:drug/metabolite transporter (DMT)-like permease